MSHLWFGTVKLHRGQVIPVLLQHYGSPFPSPCSINRNFVSCTGVKNFDSVVVVLLALVLSSAAEQLHIESPCRLYTVTGVLKAVCASKMIM